jgi:hypothetical protein
VDLANLSFQSFSMGRGVRLGGGFRVLRKCLPSPLYWLDDFSEVSDIPLIAFQDFQCLKRNIKSPQEREGKRKLCGIGNGKRNWEQADRHVARLEERSLTGLYCFARRCCSSYQLWKLEDELSGRGTAL